MTFPEPVVAAVLAHMNDDHTHDSLLIVRAFALPDAVDATMTGLDEDGGMWSATTAGGAEEVRVPWPAGGITERAEVRREIVALYDAACERLGVEARPH
ncbi:DUF2470 domain-containing protein [Nocardioides sp. W7]|uniref:DUF2470 domain-containing protein n=1 Tax=Nocardioides sp. W7 TaxID=2931390 RepID=UPI001FD35859|nr:DUF2470 domain-containing protein [Nocardioides sp. W7]